MKTKAGLAATLLLALSAAAVAEPLTFGLFESNPSRREKFERFYLIGEKLQAFELGKKRVALPPGNWLISEVETDAPDVTEEGGNTVVSETADAWLSVQDVDGGDVISFSTGLSPLNTRMSFTQLIGACQKASQSEAEGWTTVSQQQDSLREDRQSCARVSARLERSRSGEWQLLLLTSMMESWKADYLGMDRVHKVAVAEGDKLETLLQQPAIRSYVDSQLRWGVQIKADIARQMGW